MNYISIFAEAAASKSHAFISTPPTAHSISTIDQRIERRLLCSDKQLMCSQAAAEKEKEEEEEEGGVGRWVGVESSHTAVSRRRRPGEEEEKASVGGAGSWELAATATKRKWQSGDKQSSARSSALVTDDVHLAFAQAQLPK